MEEFAGPTPQARGWWSKLTPKEKWEVAIGLFGVAATVAGATWTVWNKFDSTTAEIAKLKAADQTIQQQLDVQGRQYQDRLDQLTQRVAQLNQRLDEEARQDGSRAAKFQACAQLGQQIALYSNRDDAVTTNRLINQAREERCPGY